MQRDDGVYPVIEAKEVMMCFSKVRFCLILLLATAVSAEGPASYTTLLDLRSSAQPPSSAQMLVVIDWTDTEELKRIFVRTPAGSHLTLSRIYNPVRGRTWLQIRDEETGWWAEWTEESDLKFESLEEIFRPPAYVDRLQQSLQRGDSERRIGFATRGARASVRAGLEKNAPIPGLLEELTQSLAPERVPEDSREALLFLGELTRNSGAPVAELQALIDLLCAWLRGDDVLRSSEKTAWTVERTSAERGTSADSKAQKGLLAAFPSAHLADLLSDLRGAEKHLKPPS